MEGDSAGDMGLGTFGFMGDRWLRIRGAGSLGVGDGGDQHSGCRTLHGDYGSDANHVVIRGHARVPTLPNLPHCDGDRGGRPHQ